MNFEAGVNVTPTIRLVRLLGQGGMGSVWTADHLGLHTQVAVKFMAPELATNRDAVTRFTREAAAASRVKSPHIVQVFDHGITDDGIPYIVMELMDGHDITHQVEKHGPLSVAATAHILAQACRALQKAHDAGIIHRDIKPDNVFLTDPNGEPFVKVLDFGIAKDSKMTELGMTGTGAMVGTPYYMSPEQVMSAKHVDHRTDVWAISLVAYFALTGAVPYTADNLGALCVEICGGNPAAPSTFRPDLGPAVDAFFAKALARDINQRFQSARELAAAFDQLANRAPSFVDAPTNDGLGSLGAVAASLSGSSATTRPGVAPGSVPGLSQVPGQTMSDLAASTGGAAPNATGGGKKLLLAVPVALALVAGGAGAFALATSKKPSSTPPIALAASGIALPVPSPGAPTAPASADGPTISPAAASATPADASAKGARGSPGDKPAVIHDAPPPSAAVAATVAPPEATVVKPPPTGAKTGSKVTSPPGEKDHGFLCAHCACGPVGAAPRRSVEFVREPPLFARPGARRARGLFLLRHHDAQVQPGRRRTRWQRWRRRRRRKQRWRSDRGRPRGLRRHRRNRRWGSRKWRWGCGSWWIKWRLERGWKRGLRWRAPGWRKRGKRGERRARGSRRG